LKKSHLSYDRHIHPGAIKFTTYHGSGRLQLVDGLQDHDIVLTTYETLREDWASKGGLYNHAWHRVVLDEGMTANCD
jgi:SNF2 family DNA or RNA helicase